jgi:V/A-type H+-transporting ATPase subunit I
MAIARMSKISIIAHNSILSELLTKLQGMGNIQITDLPEEEGISGPDSLNGQPQALYAETEGMLLSIEKGISYLSNLQGHRPNIIDTFFPTKLAVNQQEVERATKGFDYKRVVDELRLIEADLARLEKEKEGALLQENLLEPWSDLPLDLGGLEGTERTSLILGFTPTENYDPLRFELEEAIGDVHIEPVGTFGGQTYFMLIHMKGEWGRIEEILGKGQWEKVELPENLSGSVKEALSDLRGHLAALDKRRDELRAKGLELASHKDRLMILYDHFASERERLNVSSSLGRTEHTSIIGGWVRSQDGQKVKKAIEEEYEESYVEIGEPEDGDRVPVLMENRPLFRPFELVVNLYSRPRYAEADPTPAVMVFFSFFFALCLTDAGYGIALMVVSFLLLRRRGLGPGSRSLLQVLFISGAVTVLAGALTGGWFGPDLAQWTPLGRLVIIDPTKNPLPFLIFALGIGIVQLMVGLTIDVYDNIRQGRLLDALYDKISWIVLLSSILAFGLARMGFLSISLSTPAKIGAGAGAALIFFFAGRRYKSIAARIGWGLYSLYGLSGYLSDILSYSRLLALGVSTGIIAMVVNILAGMVKGIIPLPVLEYLPVVVVLVVGHTFNILINALGAFIHTSRLQFVEFFPKFFDGGGLAFQPFARKSRYTVVMD